MFGPEVPYYSHHEGQMKIRDSGLKWIDGMYQSNFIVTLKQNEQIPTLIALCQETIIRSLAAFRSDKDNDEDLYTDLCEEIDDALSKTRLDPTLLTPILDHFQTRP